MLPSEDSVASILQLLVRTMNHAHLSADEGGVRQRPGLTGAIAVPAITVFKVLNGLSPPGLSVVYLPSGHESEGGIPP